MTSNIAKIDLATKTKFQEEIHEPKTENELIMSNFIRSFRKSTWYSHMPVKLSAAANEDTVTYTVSDAFDYLLYTFLRQKLPALRVKKEYINQVRICWCHNIGHNIIESANLRFDDEVAQTIDSTWCDIFSQHFVPSEKWDHYKISIGSIPQLENWSTSLPEHTINAPQPWFYSRDRSLALPLFLCSLVKVTHQYKRRMRITDLLRMQIRKSPDDPWVDRPTNLRFIQGAGDGNLKTPELWGRYAYLTEDEREYNRCMRRHVFYTNDVVGCKQINSSSFGQNATVELDCKTPCLTTFWVAENMAAKRFNNYSNYTTCTDDVYQGYNPIDNTSLEYSGVKRLDRIPSDVLTMMEPYYHLPSAPREAGYNSYSFAYDPTSLDAEIGVCMSGIKSKLIASIASREVEAQTEIEEEEDDAFKYLDDFDIQSQRSVAVSNSYGDINEPTFVTHVRLLVLRKMVYEYNDERKGYVITIDRLD